LLACERGKAILRQPLSVNSPDAPSTVLGKARLYLVDDHPLVREWLATLIQQQPDLTVCGQASTSSEALAGVAAERPEVVVVDLALGGESGLELIKKLRAAHPEVLILVLSMHDGVFYAERAMKAGARAYVMKREATDKVIEAVRQILSGGIYVSAPLAAQLAERYVTSRFADGASGVARLSDRELEVFQLLGRGYENRRIADELHLSLKTVQAYCARIKEKLGLENAAALAYEAICWMENERKL